MNRLQSVLRFHERLDVPHPGICRAFNPDGWCSKRSFPCHGLEFTAYFSDMSEEWARKFIDIANGISKPKFRDREKLLPHIEDSYLMLTYIHPFFDGNGRAIKFLLNEFVERYGIELNFGTDETSRERIILATGVECDRMHRDILLGMDEWRRSLNGRILDDVESQLARAEKIGIPPFSEILRSEMIDASRISFPKEGMLGRMISRFRP